MNNDNIVIFPNIKKDSPIQSLEEIQQKILENRLEYIETIVENLSDFVYGELSERGIDIVHIPDAVLINEALRSLVFRTFNLQHDLHIVADEKYKDRNNPAGFDPDGTTAQSNLVINSSPDDVA